MNLQRTSGILLHPSSLPSRGGIGDFGPAAHEFVEFLADARQQIWQILPLNPVGLGNSPYSSISAFAGDSLLISLERLAEHGWLEPSRVRSLAGPGGHIKYEQVRRAKLPLVLEAAGNFLQHASREQRARFESFCARNAWWLEDFALFRALRRRFPGKTWNQWPADIARRDNDAIIGWREQLAPMMASARVIQFFFYEQWHALRRHCARYRVHIIGDVALFVSYDSADVWRHPEIFRLDKNFEPEAVSGVPPDAFSETGQLWGNPLYRWDVLKQRGYDWWIERIRGALALYDVIRLDHFRGFQACWEILASEPTAARGCWVDGPKDDLFHALRDALGDVPFIAEDLGMITQDVHELRRRLGIPGMRVLQFGFGNPGAHIYLPHKFEPNTVVYTGTHDNDTTLGWWQSAATAEERKWVRAYLGEMTDGVPWAFIRAAMDSIACCCVVPLQDVLGLDSSARMNVPSQADGNWTWRMEPGMMTASLARRLAELVEVTDRLPCSAAGQQSDGEVSEDFAA